jgi:hypothetical protein
MQSEDYSYENLKNLKYQKIGNEILWTNHSSIY